jgi:hypothetical protein
LGEKALGHVGEMAQSQISADVKYISDIYPPPGQKANWPTVAKLSGKTACFGVLAHLVARRRARPAVSTEGDLNVTNWS